MLKKQPLRSISPAVSLSKLFAILIAAAMLFAPFAMQSGMATAARPSDHHAQMMEQGHCEGQPADKDSKGAEKLCCAAMCTAIAVATSAPLEPAAFSRSVKRPSLKQSLHSFLVKLPTPPPRLA